MTDKVSMANKTKKITTLIVVDADGEIITSANGLVSSDNRELVRLVKRGAALGTQVRMIDPYGELVTANLDDPQDYLGITAALFSARPGRTRLLDAPTEVWDWFLDEEKHDGEGDSLADAYSAEELHEMIEDLESFKSSDAVAALLLNGKTENNEEN